MHQSFEDDDHEYLEELLALEREAARRAVEARDKKFFEVVMQSLESLTRTGERLQAREDRLRDLWDKRG